MFTCTTIGARFPAPVDDLFETLEAQDTSRCIVVSDPPSGLRAFIVIDDTTLGPAAGGVRTKRYASAREALEDAALLARAMTLKCAIAGLAHGGGKAVVMDHPGLHRELAFERLGQRIEELGGLFRTAGDLGTSETDLAAMARVTRYVSADGAVLAEAVAQGLIGCMQACADVAGKSLRGARVAIQGAGLIGRAAALAAVREGVRVIVSDLEPERAEQLAREVDGETCPASDILLADADIVAPCATGGVIDAEVAQHMKAWALCGAANNALGDPQAADILSSRGILHVPDPIASAGGVIRGLSDEASNHGTLLIRGLGATARLVLEASLRDRRTPQRIAEALAWERVRKPK
jgi:leucine dehydrogenase